MEYKRKVRELKAKPLRSEMSDHRLIRDAAVAVGTMVGDAIHTTAKYKRVIEPDVNKPIYKSNTPWEKAHFDPEKTRIRAAGSV